MMLRAKSMKPALFLLLLMMATALRAELAPDREAGWRYVLLEGSTLTDDCPVCARPPIVVPLRGSFTLRLVDANPLFSTYALAGIDFFAGGGPAWNYKVTGSGEYRIGGEVAITQEGSMKAQIDNGSVKTDAELASAPGPPGRRWPMIGIKLRQTNGTMLQEYTIEMAAAPFREVWFSTAHGLTSGTRPPPDNRISGGDLLSSTGRIVRRNAEMTARLGIMPSVPDLGLDAFDMRPGGEVTFSLESDVFSETQGPLQEGDWLSAAGPILRTNQSLLAAFIMMPPVPDAGLDAVQFFPADSPVAGGPAGEVWFSIEKSQFSERLGKLLRAGDVLSDKGVIVRTNEQLLQHFRPLEPLTDHGLDAFYVWPSGEIWFSTEKGFVGEGSITYLSGDVLSDHGYVVFRNLDLLGPFAPLEDLADFGLDAMWVVTDTSRETTPPEVTLVESNRVTGDLHLSWQGRGRVFQVEGTAHPGGTWEALTPVDPERKFTDTGVLLRQRRQFYRVLQW
jgi:hypothetical protein